MVARRRLPVAVLGLCLLHLGCGPAALEVFPAFLAEAEAFVDLSAPLASTGFQDKYHVSRIELLPDSGAGPTVLLFASEQWFEGYEPKRIAIALDGRSLSVRGSSTEDYVFDFLGADATGRRLCGMAAFEPPGFDLVPDPRLPPWIKSFRDPRTLASLPYGSANLLVGMDGGFPGEALRVSIAPADWTGDPAISSLVAPLPPTEWGPTFFLDAVRSGEGLVLLAVAGGRAVVAGFDSPSAFQAAMGQAAAGTAPLFPAPDPAAPFVEWDNAWLTEDGIVLLRHDRDTRLVRYALDAAAELDSYRPGSSEDGTSFGFDPSGRYWFRFDAVSRRLYKMRTWWR